MFTLDGLNYSYDLNRKKQFFTHKKTTGVAIRALSEKRTFSLSDSDLSRQMLHERKSPLASRSLQCLPISLNSKTLSPPNEQIKKELLTTHRTDDLSKKTVRETLKLLTSKDGLNIAFNLSKGLLSDSPPPMPCMEETSQRMAALIDEWMRISGISESDRNGLITFKGQLAQLAKDGYEYHRSEQLSFLFCYK